MLSQDAKGRHVDETREVGKVDVIVGLFANLGNPCSDRVVVEGGFQLIRSLQMAHGVDQPQDLERGCWGRNRCRTGGR